MGQARASKARECEKCGDTLSGSAADLRAHVCTHPKPETQPTVVYYGRSQCDLAMTTAILAAIGSRRRGLLY